MSDNTDDDEKLTLPPADIESIGNMLADGGKPDLFGLTRADLRAIWGVAVRITLQRRARGESQPRPAGQGRHFSRREASTLLGSMGITADEIIAGIFEEPLMQGIFLALEEVLAIKNSRAAAARVRTMQDRVQEHVAGAAARRAVDDRIQESLDAHARTPAPTVPGGSGP